MNVLKREGLLLLILVSVLILDFQRASSEVLDLAAAKTAFKAKEHAKVIEIVSQKLDVAPREALLLLSRSYSAQNNPVMAQKTLNAALAKLKGDREIATELGKVFVSMNKELEAKSTLKEVIDLHPKYEPAYLVMAEIYESKKNRYELRLLYQDLIEHVGEKSAYMTKLCDLSTKDGLYDLSFRYCQSGIRLDPREPLNYVNLAASYKETGQSAKAEIYYKKAADSFSKSEMTQSAYAAFLDESKNYVKSYTYWKRASEAGPSSTRSWAGLGNSALEIQKFADSLAAYEKLCELDKNAERQLRVAATALKTMNQTEWYEKLISLISKCELKAETRGFL